MIGHGRGWWQHWQAFRLKTFAWNHPHQNPSLTSPYGYLHSNLWSACRGIGRTQRRSENPSARFLGSFYLIKFTKTPSKISYRVKYGIEMWCAVFGFFLMSLNFQWPRCRFSRTSSRRAKESASTSNRKVWFRHSTGVCFKEFFEIFSKFISNYFLSFLKKSCV